MVHSPPHPAHHPVPSLVAQTPSRMSTTSTPVSSTPSFTPWYVQSTSDHHQGTAQKHSVPCVHTTQVKTFMSLGNKRIAHRYCHMNPKVSGGRIHSLSTHAPTSQLHFFTTLSCARHRSARRPSWRTSTTSRSTSNGLALICSTSLLRLVPAHLETSSTPRLTHLSPLYHPHRTKKFLPRLSQGGDRHMIVIETNSCPSGQKSMPRLSHEDDSNGYYLLMKTTFKSLLDGQ